MPDTATHRVALVLAAGEGTRMRSSRAKVLHGLGGRSMLGHVLASIRDAGIGRAAVVVGPDRSDAAGEAQAVWPGVGIAVQVERRGTAHAVLAAADHLRDLAGPLLVLFGDTPLLRPETLTALCAAVEEGAGVAVLGFEAADPTGYGRLVTAGEDLIAIREHKDASPDERAIRLCNAGAMAIDGAQALAWLRAIDNRNAAGEFYLTDIVGLAKASGRGAVVITAPESEVMGVNDRVQLAQAEAVLQGRLREAAMRAGATLVAPDTVFFSHDTVLGRDVVVEPHVVFGPGVTVAEGAVIHAFSHLEGAQVGPNASVGPYARLRPGTVLSEKARVGNFVEVKNATLGAGAKANHLTYVGDASIGAGANLGAGTITCNYDGFGKYRTVVGDQAFIGSNTSLVAPVTVGAGAMVGSGSVITEDVAADALALGRARQVTKPGRAAAFRAEKAALKAKASG